MTLAAAFVYLLGLVVAGVVGWVLHQLLDRPRAAAVQAVHDERVARLDAELTAARTSLSAQAHAPEQVSVAMAPVQTALERLETAVQRSQGGQAASTERIAEQLRGVMESTRTSTEGVRRETQRLVGALGQSDVRGRWGEFQLRRLMETSGLVPGVHFDEQIQVQGEVGALRPDVVVHLGSDKDVVIDAKVSLRAILRVLPDDPQDEVAAARAAHAAEVRHHVDRLASKAYSRQFDTAPEFVVMFLPAESLLSEALDADPGLLDHAFRHNIVLASPTTLMAMLRTVAHIWRQEALAANAREVQALGRELTERMTTMLGHLAKLGAALTSGVTAYNRTIASLDSRVLVTGRKFTELQGLPDLPGPAQVETTVRETAASVQDATVATRGVHGGSEPVPVDARGPGQSPPRDRFEVVDVGA